VRSSICIAWESNRLASTGESNKLRRAAAQPAMGDDTCWPATAEQINTVDGWPPGGHMSKRRLALPGAMAVCGEQTRENGKNEGDWTLCGTHMG